MLLTHVHRQSHIQNPQTPEDHAYNERSDRFWDIIHRLRDSELTKQDYFWLCKRKAARLSPSQRAFFADAPKIMDFRRITEGNPEDNCDYYNQQKLRSHAKEQHLTVVGFDALHENCSQQEGLEKEDNSFMGLPKRLELCVGAPVLLLHNLAVEHGLMNGSQGKVVEIQYAEGAHPNHERLQLRMPSVIVVDFPGFTGPAFSTARTRRPSFRSCREPLLPVTTTTPGAPNFP